MTDASKIIDPKPVGLASNGPSTSVVPGSPQLSQPPHTSDRSEADALRERIEAAATEARHGLLRYRNVDPGDRKALRFIGETGFTRIISILEGK